MSCGRSTHRRRRESTAPRCHDAEHHGGPERRHHRRGGALVRLAIVVTVPLLAGLALPALASAAAPTLLGVGQDDRHPSATFAMPGADSATIYFASQPARATDGSFLTENVEDLDFLTTDEIQAGQWRYESQLDPGTYYVILRATDYDCSDGPDCLDGFSDVATLQIPRPAQRYRGRVTRFLSTVELSLTVAPLGERLPYRVCWTPATQPRRCVRGRVDGYSWNSSATDTVSVRKRGMARTTTFVWSVDGRRVASKRVLIRPAS